MVDFADLIPSEPAKPASPGAASLSFEDLVPTQEAIPTSRPMGPAGEAYADSVANRKPAPPPEKDPFEGESLGDLAKRRGQQAAAGYGEAGASSLEGLGVASGQALKSEGSRKAAGEMLEDRGQTIADIKQRLQDPALDDGTKKFLEQNLADLEKGQGRLEDITQGDITAIRKDWFDKAEDARQWYKDTYGVAPDDPSFWGKVAQAAGGMANLLVDSAVAGNVAGKLGGLLVGGTQGATQNAGSIYKEAIAAGATDEDAVTAAGFGALVGATEIIPIGRAFKYLPSSVRQKFAGAFAKRAGEIVLDAGEEAAQEFFAQVANNTIALTMYDEGRKLLEGAGESALIGAILGGAMTGPAAILGSRDEKEKPAVITSETPPDAAAALAPTQVPPTTPQAPEAAPAAAQPQQGGVSPDAEAALKQAMPNAKSIGDRVEQVLGAPPAPAAPVTPEGNTPAQAPVTPTEPQTPEEAGDTLETVPEAPETIEYQNKALLDPANKRKAVFIPNSSFEAGNVQEPEGRTIGRLVVDEGVIYYNKAKGYSAPDVRALYKTGRLGTVLGLGEFNKADVAQSQAQGNAPVAVTERTPEGVEVKAAAGTTETAPEQLAALESQKTPGNTVQTENPARVLADRLAQAPSTATPQPLPGADTALNEEDPRKVPFFPSAPKAPPATPVQQATAQLDAIAAKNAPLQPAEPKQPDASQAVREKAIAQLEPELNVLGFQVDAVLAMPRGEQQKLIERAKRERNKAKAAEANKLVPEKKPAPVKAEIPEKSPAEEGPPSVTSEVDKPAPRIVVDPKTGKRQVFLPKSPEEQQRDAEREAEAEKVAEAAAKTAKAVALKAKRAESVEKRKAAAAEVQKKIISGEIKGAEAEAKARIAAGNSKATTRNAKKVDDSVKADEFRKEMGNTKFTVVVPEGKVAELEQQLQEAEAQQKRAKAKRIREELESSTTVKRLRERLRNIMTEAQKRGIEGRGKLGDTSSDSLIWLGDIAMMAKKLDSGKPGNLTTEKWYGEINDWLADEVSLMNGDSTMARERRRLYNDLISNKNKSAGGDVENVAEVSATGMDFAEGEDGTAQVVQESQDDTEGPASAEDLGEAASAADILAADDKSIGARTTAGRHGPIRSAGKELSDRIKDLAVQLAPLLERDGLTLMDLFDAVTEEPTKVRKYLSEAEKATVKRIDPKQLSKEERERIQSLVSQPTEQPTKVTAPKAVVVKKVAKKRASKALFTKENLFGKDDTETDSRINRMASGAGKGAVTKTAAFKAWFGDSKVVDADGKPLVVYHGTQNDFSEFRRSSTGEFGPGAYFSSLPQEAADYAGTHPFAGKGPNILPVYLRMENPFVVKKSPQEFWDRFGSGKDDSDATSNAIAAGYDGVIFTRPYMKWDDAAGKEVGTGIEHTHFIVFDPTQVKSAFNNGEFNPNDPRINRMAKGTDAQANALFAKLMGIKSAVLPPKTPPTKQQVLDTMENQTGGMIGFNELPVREIDATARRLGLPAVEPVLAERTTNVYELEQMIQDPQLRRDALNMATDTFKEDEVELMHKVVDGVMAALTDIVGDVPVHIVSDDTMTALEGGADVAYYRNDQDFIVVPEGIANNPARAMHVLTHEVSHAAFVHAMNADPDIQKQVDWLMEKAWEWKKANSYSVDPYGFKNRHEFISEAFSNPEFQTFLALVPIDEKAANAEVGLGLTGIRNRVVSALDVIRKQLVDLLHIPEMFKHFGVDPNTPSALEAMFVIGDALLKVSTESRKSRLGKNYHMKFNRMKGGTPKGNKPDIKKIVRNNVTKKMRDRGLNARQAVRVASIIRDKYDGKVTDEQLDEIADLIKGDVNEAQKLAKAAQATAKHVKAKAEALQEEALKAAIEEFQPTKNPGRPWLLKVLTNAQIGRLADRFYGSENNPVRKIAEIIERRRVLRDHYEKALGKAVEDIAAAQKTHKPEDMKNLFDLAHDATMAGVHPDFELTDSIHAYLGKDAMKGVYGKAAHPELKKKFDALPDSLKDLYRRTRDTLTEAQNRMSYGAMRNVLSAAGFKDEAMARRFHEGTATELDYEMVGEVLGRHLAHAAELKKMNGPYFNLMRHGDHVVAGRVKITPPGNAVLIASDNSGEAYGFSDRKQAEAFIKKMADEGLYASLDSVWIDKNTGEMTAIDNDGTKVRISKNDTDAVRQFRVKVQNRHIEFVDGAKAARKLAKTLREDGIEDVYWEAKAWERDAQNAQMLSDQHRMLMTTLDKDGALSKMDAVQKAELRATLNEVSLRFLGSTRIQSSRMPRRHIQGASKDLLKNTYDYVRETSGYLAKMDTEPMMERELDNLEARHEALRTSPVGANAGSRLVVDEIKKRALDPDYGDNNGTVARGIDRWLRVSFINYLLSPAYSAINALQPYAMALPILSGDFNPIAANLHLRRAQRDLAAVRILASGVVDTAKAVAAVTAEGDFVDGMKSRLKLKRETDMLQELADVGLIDGSGGLENVTGLEQSPSAIMRGVDKVLDYTENLARALPQAVEAVNRGPVALAAYRLMFNKTGDHAKSVQYAKDIVDRSQGNYSATNAPPAMNNNFARLVFQFKKYPQMVYAEMFHNVYKVMKGETAEERVNAATTLAYFTASQVVFAGVMGVPFLEFARVGFMLLTALGFDDWEWEEWEDKVNGFMQDMLGDTGGDMATFGASRGIPGGWAFDLNDRMGMDSLLTYGAPRSDKTSDLKSWLFDTLGGPAVATGIDMVAGIRDLNDGNISKGLEKLVPMKIFTDTMKAAREFNAGKMNEQDAILRVLGLKSARQAVISEEKSKEINAASDKNDRRNGIISAYVNADTAGQREKALSQMKEYNDSLGKNERKLTKDYLVKLRIEEMQRYKDN